MPTRKGVGETGKNYRGKCFCLSVSLFVDCVQINPFIPSPNHCAN